jgi:hypothetical protein
MNIKLTPYNQINKIIDAYKDEIIIFKFSFKRNDCDFIFVTKEDVYNIKLALDEFDFSFFIDNFCENFKTVLNNCNEIISISVESYFLTIEEKILKILQKNFFYFSYL